MKKLLTAVAALTVAASAQASIIPTLIGGPVAVGGGSFRYTYDATLIAAKILCEKILVQNINHQSYKKLPLLRDYPSRTANNFISKMNIVRFGKGN